MVELQVVAAAVGLALGIWLGWELSRMAERRAAGKPGNPERDGCERARREFMLWKLAQRHAEAYHRELERLQATDVDRPSGRAS